ncbi:hypothetical protein [Novosphingobium naphthalenivorans]|uniref:hypothetical protein n=1 Tax=Novosphingobium naphthalenivorans TaxID=273168 RepID=UPI0012EE6486|nr:hypothetical protein [Novosphingobium naphthalenivorans]
MRIPSRSGEGKRKCQRADAKRRRQAERAFDDGHCNAPANIVFYFIRAGLLWSLRRRTGEIGFAGILANSKATILLASFAIIN